MVSLTVAACSAAAGRHNSTRSATILRENNFMFDPIPYYRSSWLKYPMVNVWSTGRVFHHATTSVGNTGSAGFGIGTGLHGNEPVLWHAGRRGIDRHHT